MTQNQSNIQVIGIPFSTFTRTICMGLVEKNVPYSLVHAPPHSDIAKKSNPFGKIPSLIQNDINLTIFESLAIANYINNFSSKTELRPKGLEVQVDRWMSVCSDYIFASVEHGVVKPRLSLQKSNIAEPEIEQKIHEGVKRMVEVLTIASDLMSTDGPFVCGTEITWGDLFLLPIIADVMAIPEKKFVPAKIAQWYQVMESRPSFPQTRNGTLEGGHVL